MATTPAGSGSRSSADRQAAAAALGKASALIDLGRHADAIRAAEEGLAAAPNDPALLRLRALALQGAGKIFQAVDAASAAIAAAPNQPSGFVVRASIVTSQARAETDLGRRRGFAHRAARDAAEAVRLAPHLANAHRQLAESLAYAGEGEQAWGAARRAAELDPHNEATWVTFSVVGIACDADPVAIEVAARRALSINPLSYAALNNLGVALMKQGRKREAAPLLRQAAASSPGRNTAVENLAKVGASVIRLAVLAALCGLFFTPIGPATIVILIVAASVLFRPWATKKMRKIAIRTALALPGLRLPSTSSILGLLAVGLAAYTLTNGGSRALSIVLVVGGAAAVIYPPVRIRWRRARIARRGFDRFPSRPVRSRLSGGGGRPLNLRPIIIVIWLGAVIANAAIHNSSNQTGNSLSSNFNANSIPLPPITTEPVDPSNPSTVVQAVPLPRGFVADPPETGPVTAAEIATDFGTNTGMESAYRQTAIEDQSGQTGPRGSVYTDTVIAFTLPAQATAFVHAAMSQPDTSAPEQLCKAMYVEDGPGRDTASMFVTDDADVIVAEFTQDSNAHNDIDNESAALLLAVPTLLGSGC